MLNKRETVQFCSSLKMMLASGMPLLQALQIVGDSKQGKKYKVGITASIEKIKEGSPFFEAVSGLLPPLAIGSIKAAECSGNLEESLAKLAEFYERKAEMEEKIKAALIYPLLILILSLLSVLALLFFVLPAMGGLFSDFGGELPLFTRLILGTSLLFSHNWPAILLGMAFGLFLIMHFWKKEPETVEKIGFKIPLVSKLAKQELAAQLFGSLGAMLNGGIPILEALEITVETSGSQVFKKLLLNVKNRVENGWKLSDSLQECGFFYPETIQLLRVGENSSQLAGIMLNISEIQSFERDAALKKFTTLLEPVLTLLVGGVVAIVVLAMFLPMVDMISRLN